MMDYYCSRCGNDVGSNEFCTRCMTGIHVKKSKKNDMYSSGKKVKRMTGIHRRKGKRPETKSNILDFGTALPPMLIDVCCNCGYKFQIELGRNVLEKIFDCPKCNNRLKSRRPL